MILNRCPTIILTFTMIVTFNMIFNRIRDYFDMDIKATRLNWYIIAVKDN